MRKLDRYVVKRMERTFMRIRREARQKRHPYMKCWVCERVRSDVRVRQPGTWDYPLCRRCDAFLFGQPVKSGTALQSIVRQDDLSLRGGFGDVWGLR